MKSFDRVIKRPFADEVAACTEMPRKSYIINNLDRAMAEGWIEVYYQPIVRAANGAVCNEEALSRWHDPEYGMIPPAVFVPVLEESGQIYKLDLYVVEKILEDTGNQAIAGLYVLPQTINISCVDFEYCDMAEEISKRLEASGVGRKRIVIEVRESEVAADPERIKKEVEKLRNCGFKVWLDDFGMGYASLDSLQNIEFDAVKLDMRFMDRFDHKTSKIIMTELIKMATRLDLDTIAVGVETEEQVEYLKEIGCTKLQGFYYCEAIPLRKIVERYEQGSQIGFEDPEESGYYESIGSISLYDLDYIINEDNDDLKKYFDAVPIAVLEQDGDRLYAIRCNEGYKRFLEEAFSIKGTGRSSDHSGALRSSDAAIFRVIEQSRQQERRILFEEKIGDKLSINAFLRHVADNPVTGVSAYSIAILSMNQSHMSGVTFAHVARALSADYINLYYVDIVSDQFIEYNPDANSSNLSVERHGEDFFNASRTDAIEYIYIGDRDRFIDAFTKENILESIDGSGTFALSYRLLIDDEPRYVNMKAVRMDERHIIIGVNDVDAYMRRVEALERVREEQASYARITALSGDYIAIYSVDPDTEEYMVYNATNAYEGLGLASSGVSFFEETRRIAPETIYHDDVTRFTAIFTKENVLFEIEQSGLFEITYRLMMEGEPVYVSLKAAMVTEKDGPRIIIGVSNIDERVRRDREYSSNLQEARQRANVDALTGVRNKHAYVDLELELDHKIDNGIDVEFAIVVLDLNGLKAINDAHGHQTGDNFLRAGCRAICDVFDHSPVFRVGGDEFAVIAQGRDYENLDELIEEMRLHNERCLQRRMADADAAAGDDMASKAASMTVEAGRHERGENDVLDFSDAEVGQIYDFKPEDIVIACGVARYEGDRSVAAVFDRADLAMYENKQFLKGH